MSLILEDGTAPAGANSYATETMADDYFDARGNTTWTDSTDDKEAALIRATQAIDALYRGRWPGYRSNFRSQNLEWPRTNAYDTEGNIIDSDEIPQEVIDATCEAAIRELATSGSMIPDLDRGGDIRAITAGSVSIQYGAAAAVTTTFSLIDGILSKIIGAATPYTVRLVRG